MPDTAKNTGTDMETDAIDWLRRMGMVANALTGDMDAQEVAEIVLHQGMAGMGASGATVVFRYGDNLVPVAVIGTTVETMQRTGPLTIDRQLPMCHALVHGEPVWVSGREEGLARFANLRDGQPTSQGWAAAPLMSGGRPFGAFSLVFDTPPAFGPVERQFVTTLTGLAALALSRLVPHHGPGGVDHHSVARELVEAMISAPPDGVLVVNTQGVIVRASRQLCAMFGYDDAALEGQPVEVLIPEGSRFHHRRDLERYLVEPGPRPLGSGMALTGRRADGSEFPLDVSLSPCATASGLYVIAVVHDASGRPAQAPAPAWPLPTAFPSKGEDRVPLTF